MIVLRVPLYAAASEVKGPLSEGDHVVSIKDRAEQLTQADVHSQGDRLDVEVFSPWLNASLRTLAETYDCCITEENQEQVKDLLLPYIVFDGIRLRDELVHMTVMHDTLMSNHERLFAKLTGIESDVFLDRFYSSLYHTLTSELPNYQACTYLSCEEVDDAKAISRLLVNFMIHSS